MNNDVVARKRSLFYPKADLDVDNALFSELRLIRDELSGLYINRVKDLICQFFKKNSAQVVPVVTRGTFHLIYQATVGTDRYIVKIMLPELPLYDASFMIDQWIYERLAHLQLPSVPVYAVDFTQAVFPFSYAIIGFAQGVVLSDLQDQHTQYVPVSILESLGHTMAHIHEISLEGFGPVAISQGEHGDRLLRGVHQSWSDYIFCHLNSHITTCADVGALSFLEADRIGNLFMQYAPLFNLGQGFLLHGDLGGHNIFSDGIKVTAIIDWEDSMVGDPLFDLAYWGTFVRDYMRDELMWGYKRYSPLPADFEVRYWLYYLRIALSKTVHRYRFKYTDHPARPAASMRIQKALARLEQLNA